MRGLRRRLIGIRNFAGEKWLLGIFESNDWWLRVERLEVDKVFERLQIQPSLTDFEQMALDWCDKVDGVNFPNFPSTFVPITKKSSASIASRMQSDLRRKDKNSSAPSTREVVVIYHISAFVFTLIIIFGIIIFFNGGVIIVVIVKHILFFALISS